MATTKKRLNITLSDDLDEILDILARGDNVPKATKAREMIEEAVEMHEDMALVELAENRDTPDAEYVLAEEAQRFSKE
ncbi:MAG: CopG family transcriptional regulator [Candidatus Paceibacterota bacterium]